jgi:carbonic anhydrase/acetyltransferase-like protein (isoleucine patch superfamily)
VTVYALGELVPEIDPTAYVHPDATVIGDVVLGPGASVWPQAVLRGDAGRIEVGARTSVQDGTVVHCTEWHPTVIGADCVLGHNVHVEGATIGVGCLIASGSVVLNGSVVEDGAVVGAGAVVSFNGHVPARRMALGVPAKIRPDHEVPADYAAGIVARYQELSAQHRDGLRRLS